MHLTSEQINFLRAALRRSLSLSLVLFTASTLHLVAGQQQRTAGVEAQGERGPARALYRISLTLDFDNRTFTGIERVRWTNKDDHPASVLYFHLYSNKRLDGQRSTPSATTNASDTLLPSDEPHLEVSEVRGAGVPLYFALDDSATTMRVNLREQVITGASVEIEIKFKGSVPEVDPEETGLFVHVLQQVGAALRSEREVRRARDINFSCRGMMLLGTAYPVLATRDGDDWQRKVETSIGDIPFTDAADYHVTIETPSDVIVFASGEARRAQSGAHQSSTVHEFGGESLRDFAVFAGRTLRSEERLVGEVKVRSIFTAEHERVGRRVLTAATDAVRVYTARFGALPYKTINIAEAPLVASLGSAEFTGLVVIASAFYVDFDSPLVRNLPEIVREQRASLEDSLEFTAAHVVAHQWWGAAVGSDPERNPVLDEALANWSALLYYKDVHGEERAGAALEDQLRGVYKIYRTFGGEDMAADRNARDYRNVFQYSAIVASKGAMMFVELRRLMGNAKFFNALRNYYQANMFEIAEMDDLRGAFIAEAPLWQRRVVARTFNRWLTAKRGDQDIAPPDPQLALALGINPNASKGNDRNAFARLGKFFWQQMTRIR